MAQPQTVAGRTAGKTAPKSKTKSAGVKTKTQTKTKRPDTDLAVALEKMLAGEDEVVIYKDGKKAGAIISARAYKFLMKKVREEEDRRDIETIRQARAKNEKTIPWEQLKAELGL